MAKDIKKQEKKTNKSEVKNNKKNKVLDFSKATKKMTSSNRKHKIYMFVMISSLISLLVFVPLMVWLWAPIMGEAFTLAVEEIINGWLENVDGVEPIALNPQAMTIYLQVVLGFIVGIFCYIPYKWSKNRMTVAGLRKRIFGLEAKVSRLVSTTQKDFSKMTAKQLQTELKKANVEFDKKATKEDLLKLIETNVAI